MIQSAAVILALVVVSTMADIPGVPKMTIPGKCANVKLHEKFELERYSGKWYWVSMIENSFLSKMSKCIRSEYTYDSEMVGFNVTTSGKTSDDQTHSSTGIIRTTMEFPHASMSILFDNVLPANYFVVETDYTSYSCVYSCTQTSGFKTEFGFVYSRYHFNYDDAAQKCAEAFKRNGVDYGLFKPVDQNCQKDLTYMENFHEQISRMVNSLADITSLII